MPQGHISNSPSFPPGLSNSTSTATDPSYPSGSSRAETPSSSVQPSPTVNLSREYNLNIQTESYKEIWSKIRENVEYSIHQEGDIPDSGLILSQVLQPNRECVQEALSRARSSSLTSLVSDYFTHSENTSSLCLQLHQSVLRARFLYAPIYDLLEIFPLDFHDLTDSQCIWAHNVLLQFDSHEKPFPCPDSHNFHDIRKCFTVLKEQLDQHLRKSQSKVRMFSGVSKGSAFCLIGTAFCIAVSAVVVASHFLLVVVASPFFVACLPPKCSRKELAHLVQLEAAKKGIFVLNNELDTIVRLVDSLYTATEGHKLLIRIGLERGPDKHPIYEVVKQLRKDHVNFMEKLEALEQHLCLCFATVNRARSLLLQEINTHQEL